MSALVLALMSVKLRIPGAGGDALAGLVPGTEVVLYDFTSSSKVSIPSSLLRKSAVGISLGAALLRLGASLGLWLGAALL